MIGLPYSDSALVKRALGEHSGAFEALVHRYQKKAYAVSRAAGVKAAGVDDVVQTSFVHAFRHLSGLRSPESFGPWFLQIVRNVARKQLRKPTPASMSHPCREHEEATPAADDPLEAQDFREYLWRQVATLPAEVREAIFLYYHEGQSVREVARAARISRSGVRKRLARGRELLKERLWRELDECLRDMLPSARQWDRNGRRLVLLATASLSPPLAAAPTATSAAAGTAVSAKGETVASLAGGAKLAAYAVAGAFLVFGGVQWLTGSPERAPVESKEPVDVPLEEGDELPPRADEPREEDSQLPPYPYDVPAAHGELLQRLEVNYSFVVSRPAPLQAVLKDLTTLTGVPFRLEDKAREEAARPVTLEARENVPLRQVLDLLAEPAGLSVRVTLGGVVFTARPDDHPEPAAVWRKIEGARARKLAAMVPEPAAHREVRKALQTVTIRSLRWEETPLAQFAATVGQICGKSIRLEPTVDGALMVTGTFRDVSAEEMLRTVLDDLELDFAIRDGAVVILGGEEARREKQAREDRERAAKKVTGLWATVIPARLDGLRVRELVPPLRNALDVPVYPGPKAWRHGRRLESVQGVTLRELARRLEAIGIEVIVEADAVYLLVAPKK